MYGQGPRTSPSLVSLMFCFCLFFSPFAYDYYLEPRLLYIFMPFPDPWHIEPSPQWSLMDMLGHFANTMLDSCSTIFPSIKCPSQIPIYSILLFPCKKPLLLRYPYRLNLVLSRSASHLFSVSLFSNLPCHKSTASTWMFKPRLHWQQPSSCLRYCGAELL